MLSAAEADSVPKQQASLNSAAGKAPAEADMDEVRSSLLSHVSSKHRRLASRHCCISVLVQCCCRVIQATLSLTQPEQECFAQETDEEGEDEAPAAHLVESQAERVRRSLVTLDINLPSIALPDGVHCRSFTGTSPIIMLAV